MPDPERNRSLNPEPSAGLQNPAAFAPTNPTDYRERLDWQSKYPSEARSEMWREGIYLAALLFSVPLSMLSLWLDLPKNWFHLTDQQYGPVLKYGLAWLGGVLGGTLFAIKWLYHSIARQIWHLDRRPWRLFTPHISGGLAFGVIALVSSGIFRVLDRQAPESKSLVVAVAFMTGYFSDSAVAKLTEIAETLFGASRGKERHLDAPKPTAKDTKGVLSVPQTGADRD